MRTREVMNRIWVETRLAQEWLDILAESANGDPEAMRVLNLVDARLDRIKKLALDWLEMRKSEQ